MARNTAHLGREHPTNSWIVRSRELMVPKYADSVVVTPAMARSIARGAALAWTNGLSPSPRPLGSGPLQAHAR